MPRPARITKAEFKGAITAAKANGATRVIFDHGRIVVDFRTEEKRTTTKIQDPISEWDDAK